LDRHRVWVFEVALGGIIDDILEAHIDRLVAKLYLERLIRLVSQGVEKFTVHGGRLFSYQSRKRGSFRTVALAGGTEAAEQVDLKLRRLSEFVGRKFFGALLEVIGDAHRTDRVRARRTRPHFVELVRRRQHGPRALLDHI